MGLFGGSDDLRKAMDAQRALIQQQGARINEQIKTGADAKRSEIAREHAERIAPVEEKINTLQQQRAALRNQFEINTACNTLDRNIKMALMMHLATTSASDPKTAVETMRKEVDSKISALKANPDDATLISLGEWAVSQLADNEDGKVKVQTAVQAFRASVLG